ncbi:MAG: penicillin-binding protein 2 [Chloroflexota bacterium]
MKTKTSFPQPWRIQVLTVFLCLASAVLLIWTIRIQFSREAADLRQMGDDLYQGVWLDVDPPRGAVLDSSGHLFAGNHLVYEVGIELAYVETPEAIAKVLDAILGVDPEDALAIASLPYALDSVYAVVKRGVTTEQAEALQKVIELWDDSSQSANGESLEGLVMFPYLARTYPEGDLASNIIGFVARDGIGYYGLEQRFDNELTGISQKVWVPNNPNYASEMPEIPSGDSIVLTVDREIQAMVELQLDAAVDEYDAKSGTVIIMHPETGEILAMATSPRLDINEYWRFPEVYPGTTPFNRAISQTFEPGSVFKVFTMAAAIDAETVEYKTTFLDTGAFEFGGIIIRNWNRDAWGEQDMAGCMRHSLNVCLAWIGTEMGADLFYEYMDDFGFGHYTGVDLAGEVTGRLKEPGDGDWYHADLATNTFGQGISVTPLQLVVAAGALANEGTMLVPHVTRSIVDERSQYNVHTQVYGQPISAETAESITEMLAQTLEEAGSRARVPGYRIAGKTGTAEIPGDNGYTREITNASFLGWGPADDPKFVVYVWLEEMQEPASIWGSQTAAPLFSDIVERLVVLMKIPPDNVRRALEEN